MEPILELKSKIRISTDSRPLANAILKAISPEAAIPLGRSSTKFKLKDTLLDIVVSAEDITSLRATVTPLLKWIQMVCDMWKIGGK